MKNNCYIIPFSRRNLNFVTDHFLLGRIISKDGVLLVSEFILIDLNLMLFSFLNEEEAEGHKEVSRNEIITLARDYKINNILDNE